jgi:hypothetical protein
MLKLTPPLSYISKNTLVRLVALTATVVTTTIFTGCGTTLSLAPQETPTAYVMHTASGPAQVRVVTQDATCPSVQFDGGAATPMVLRAGPSVAQSASVPTPVVFNVSSCELNAPMGAKTARVNGLALNLPATAPQRIVVIGDSGCRLKGSTTQACNDPAQWPFAQIAQAAAALKPDLVVHLGDMHYRETPCPPGNSGCAGSPSGYGFDAWNADFFAPAQPLLQAAPWIFVRGNHENCSRAGLGWFRFMAGGVWGGDQACSDFSEPYAVRLDADTQFVVFDSSKTSNQPYTPADAAFQTYLKQFEQVKALTEDVNSSFFLSHHPVLALSPMGNTSAVYPGNLGLQSVMEVVTPQRLFPPGVKLALHGHTHFFEFASFASHHPDTFIVGNSGTALDPELPNPLPANASPAPFTQIAQISSRSQFGFMTLDKQPQGWLTTLRDVQGGALLECLFVERLVCKTPP